MLRKEISGLHLYEKSNGLHVLFDEITCKEKDILNVGPRQLSIMLTKKCNLECSFCYAQKGNTEINWRLIENILDASEKLSILDLTLGGGEPTLYSNFKNLVNIVDEKYQFGLSVTTNGTNIELFKDLKFKLSKVRVSLDSFERNLNTNMKQNLLELQNYQNIGINLLYSPNSHKWLEKTIDELKELNILDVLIIPEHSDGNFILNDQDWKNLESIVFESKEKSIDIKITSDAEKYIKSPILDNAHKNEFLFLHIDDDGNLKEKSWSFSKCNLSNLNTNQIIKEILKLNKGIQNENME